MSSEGSGRGVKGSSSGPIGGKASKRRSSTTLSQSIVDAMKTGVRRKQKTKNELDLLIACFRELLCFVPVHSPRLFMSVIIETSVGEITIDLMVDVAPIACKNFLKLCKMKYYNNCIFHNVQHDFIVQTGDPTGTGRGGESIFGSAFSLPCPSPFSIASPLLFGTE